MFTLNSDKKTRKHSTRMRTACLLLTVEWEGVQAGVSGGVQGRVCASSGCVHGGVHSLGPEADTPPDPEAPPVDRQMPVKILPCSKLRFAYVITDSSMRPYHFYLSYYRLASANFYSLADAVLGKVLAK